MSSQDDSLLSSLPSFTPFSLARVVVRSESTPIHKQTAALADAEPGAWRINSSGAASIWTTYLLQRQNSELGVVEGLSSFVSAAPMLLPATC